MRRNRPRRSRLVAILLIVIIVSSAGNGIAARPMSNLPKILEIHGGSIEQRQIVSWAAGRFPEAGLNFPLPSIYLHEGTRRCAGNGGFTDVLPEGVTVHICVEDDTDLARKLLHEIAHVWDFAYGGITPKTRAEFLALRDLGSWNDRDDDWPERGAEQAAEILAWGLQESIAPIPTRVRLVGPDDLDSLTTAFQLLVGVPPLWLKDVDHLRSLRATGLARRVTGDATSNASGVKRVKTVDITDAVH